MTTHRRSGGLGALVAVAIGVAACGGPSSPSVANVATTSPGSAKSTATTVPKNNAGASLIEWASCMRRHGDPDQADPTIDSHGVINIYIPRNAASLSNAVHNGTAPCNEFLAAASAALRAASPPGQPPDQVELVEYAQCMRANGVPNYPDPGTGGTTNLNGIDMNSQIFVRANNVCGKKINAPSWWISGAGPPGDITVQSGFNGAGPPPRRGATPNRETTGAGTSGNGG